MKNKNSFSKRRKLSSYNSNKLIEKCGIVLTKYSDYSIDVNNFNEKFTIEHFVNLYCEQ